MGDLHVCMHERELGAVTSSTERLERQLSEFLKTYQEESKAVAVALNSVVTMNEQTADLLGTLQNTMHGPNRDNGVVQTALEGKMRLADLSLRVGDTEAEVEAVKIDVNKLQKEFIKIAAAISIMGTLLVNSIPVAMKVLGHIVDKAMGPAIEHVSPDAPALSKAVVED